MNSDLKNFYGILIKWKPWTVYWKYFYFLKIGHATNLHEADYPQNIPEGVQLNFGYPAYTLHEWQQNFAHPAYQSGRHQPLTQLPANLGHQGQHFIHTTYPIHGDGTGSGNEGNDSQVCMKVQTWS